MQGCPCPIGSSENTSTSSLRKRPDGDLDVQETVAEHLIPNHTWSYYMFVHILRSPPEAMRWWRGRCAEDPQCRMQ